MDPLDNRAASTRQASGLPKQTGLSTTALPARAVRPFPAARPDGAGNRNPQGAPAGSRTLRPGRAVRWVAADPGILRITHGRVWGTRTGAGPHHPDARGGDHFFDAGDRLNFSAGDEWLLEAWAVNQLDTAVFSWTPGSPASTAVPVDWRAEVLAPLDELGIALRQAAQSARHLASGLIHASIAILNVANYCRYVRSVGRFIGQSGKTPAG